LLSLLTIPAEICTKGPSLPTDNPPAKAEKSPRILPRSVLKDKYLKILTPANIDFNSGIPEPSASLLTNCPIEAAMAVKKNDIRIHMIQEDIQLKPYCSTKECLTNIIYDTARSIRYAIIAVITPTKNRKSQ